MVFAALLLAALFYLVLGLLVWIVSSSHKRWTSFSLRKGPAQQKDVTSGSSGSSTSSSSGPNPNAITVKESDHRNPDSVPNVTGLYRSVMNEYQNSSNQYQSSTAIHQIHSHPYSNTGTEISISSKFFPLCVC